MKNHSRIILAAILLMGGMLIADSCTKEGGFSRSGQLISFGTVSPGTLTKTEYAGKDNDVNNNDGNTIEPIWWGTDDEIRIVSDVATVTDRTEHYADYIIQGFVNGNKSKATLKNKKGNGLAWGDAEDVTYTFYAVYPSSVNIGYEEGNLGSISAQIPNPQAVSAHVYSASSSGTARNWYNVTTDNKYTVYEPEMKYAFMTAKTTFKTLDSYFDAHRYVLQNNEEENGPEVALTFNPAFTAFEFTFESADPSVDIDLTEFRMESIATSNTPATALTGTFTGTAGDTKFSPVQTASTKLSLSNPSALGTIKNGQPKSFTVFAIPQDLTNLWIFFADKDGNGATRTRKLALNDKTTGKPLTFEAGKKYRIKGLKLPGNQYQFFLTLNGVVQDWVATTVETIFSDQIQCGALTFDKSAREMTDAYIDGEGNGKTNHYQSPAPVGDGRWQVRTLNNIGLDGEPNHQYFTVTFTPTAPLGGYWRLVAHDDPTNPRWKIEMVEHPGEYSETVLPLPNPGRVMNEKVTLRITPLWEVINETPLSEEIGLYFDCYFSTNIDFDPVLDANTEFQDIHGAGTYSYWLLTVERQ